MTGKVDILIVDDQAGIRNLLSVVLEEDNYRVATAANGEEGVRLAADLQPELVLMDIKMPVMDGIEALKRIRSFDQNVKIVIMTAYGEANAVKSLLKYGCTGYIMKPFDIIKLKQYLYNLLSSESFKNQAEAVF